MLWTIVAILIILWLLGWGFHVAGGLIHLLLVAALIVAAFNLFDEVARAPENRLSFFLERGEMLVLNNYTVMHARTEFRNFPEPERQRRLIRLWLDRPGFRDVPKEFNLFKTNGVPPQPGKRATFDFRKLYAEDPVATGGMPKL